MARIGAGAIVAEHATVEQIQALLRRARSAARPCARYGGRIVLRWKLKGEGVVIWTPAADEFEWIMVMRLAGKLDDRRWDDEESE